MLNSLIMEAKLANFYMTKIWPIKRHFVSKSLYMRCNCCILSEKYISINPENGMCSLCEGVSDETSHNVHWHNFNDELNQLISSAIGDNPNSQFHALALFSGGKDSCYMLLRLKKEFPDLRILCLSVDNTFMSPFAIENINQSIKKIGLPHLWVRLPSDMCEKMFRFSLLRSEPKGLLDFLDGELISDIARNTAARFKIPLILMGLTSEQVEKILKLDTFRHPHEKEFHPRSDVAGIPLDDIFDNEDKKWWWQGASKESPPAAFLFPLATWQVGEDEIKQEVFDSKLLENANLDPVLTNQSLIIPMVITDYLRHGYFCYEPEFAEMIRSGKASRKDWIYTVEIFEFASKTGKLLPKTFDKTLNRLKLDRQSLGIPTN